MSSTQPEFDQLQATVRDRGVAAALEDLAKQLLADKRYHELFEARKMQLRQRLGLPLSSAESTDDLPPETRTKLEDGLIEACREVGLLLLDAGRVREGWMYLRPVGDRAAAREALAKIDNDDGNLEELVEVCLYEGVDPARGFDLVLRNYGTCNAITTFEGALSQHSLPHKRIAAAMLVDHLHGELVKSVRADIARQEGAEPPEGTLRELVADRPWLFGEYSYHLDTTHLASTVRCARLLDARPQLEKALDLTEYGRRLSRQYQYQGDEPFAEIYPSHALYYQALVGQNVDEAIAYFQEKAKSLDPRDHGTLAIEIYVELLSRIGRAKEAIEASTRLLPKDTRPLGIAPTLLELSRQAGDYNAMLAHCREQGDLLGFATALAQSTIDNPR